MVVPLAFVQCRPIGHHRRWLLGVAVKCNFRGCCFFPPRDQVNTSLPCEQSLLLFCSNSTMEKLLEVSRRLVMLLGCVLLIAPSGSGSSVLDDGTCCPQTSPYCVILCFFCALEKLIASFLGVQWLRCLPSRRPSSRTLFPSCRTGIPQSRILVPGPA